MVIPPGGAPSMIPLPVSASAIVVSSGKGGNGGLPPGGETDENAGGLKTGGGDSAPQAISCTSLSSLDLRIPSFSFSLCLFFLLLCFFIRCQILYIRPQAYFLPPREMSFEYCRRGNPDFLLIKQPGKRGSKNYKHFRPGLVLIRYANLSNNPDRGPHQTSV